MISLYCCVYTGVLCTDLCILKNRCVEEDGLVIFCSGGCSVSSLNRIMLSNTLSHRFSDTKVTGKHSKDNKNTVQWFSPPSSEQTAACNLWMLRRRKKTRYDRGFADAERRTRNKGIHADKRLRYLRNFTCFVEVILTVLIMGSKTWGKRIIISVVVGHYSR